jgi:hypothetical protein
MTTQAIRHSYSPDAAGTTSRAGAGYSENADSFAAGREAALEALRGAGGRADIVLAYTTSMHDPKLMLDGVRDAVGKEAVIAGGSAVGVITNDRLGYEGTQVGVAVMNAPSIRADLFGESGLDVRGEAEVGHALGRRLAGTSFSGEPNLLLMYDSVKKPQAELNVATALLDGIGAELTTWPRMAGVGVFSSMQFFGATVLLDDRAVSQSAAALVLSGGVQMDTIIMHGCRPAGRYYTVTRSEGAKVLEIEGRPALEFVGDLIPNKDWEEYPLFVTFGVNRGDPFGEFREEDYSNHLCMAIDRENKALLMFEPNLTPGTRIQLMRRSIDFDYVARRVETLFETVGDRRPFFALYIDCAGRASAYCGSEGEEAAAVQRAMTERGVPVLGMYSGVEIAKVGGAPRALDWTGVLCVFSDPA